MVENSPIRIGIYIDLPNLNFALEDIGRRIQINKLNQGVLRALTGHMKPDETSRGTFIAVSKIFYDLRPEKKVLGLDAFLGFFRSNGYLVEEVPMKQYSEEAIRNGQNRFKSRTDSHIIASVTEDIATDKVDMVIIFSGDCDYEICLKKAHLAGKKIVFISTFQMMARELREDADYAFDLNSLDIFQDSGTAPQSSSQLMVAA